MYRKGWRYYRDTTLMWVTFFVFLGLCGYALRHPIYWIAALAFWGLRIPFRNAFYFAHPYRRVGWIGLVPLALNLGYTLANGISRFSSWRVLEIDARYALREQGGGLVEVTSQGYRHGPPEVLAALAHGEAVDPSAYFFRTVMRFTTGAPALAWLNRTIAVSTGARRARQVLLQAFALL